MPVDSELLGSFGLLLEREIFSHGDYSLSRVNYRGRKLVAEISSSDGIFQHRWPSVRGLRTPISARDIPGGKKLLLFDCGSSVFLCESIQSNGGFSEQRALELVRMALRIVTDLQSAGMICGYLGPEMFVQENSELVLLAGRRGVPDSSFTPPEVGPSRPSDPRSDVSAVGSLLFRLIAGTDDRERQLQAWNRLNEPFQKAVQEMVAADPVNRPGSLRAVAARIDELLEGGGEEHDQENVEIVHSEGFVKKTHSGKEGSSGRKFWYIAAPLILIVAYLVFRFSGPPAEDYSSTQPDSPPDSIEFQETVEVTSPWTEDTVSAVPSEQLNTDILLADTARVWVTNCTGTPNVENQFRAGPLSDFSYVYLLTGTSRRRTSLITVRRHNPLLPRASSELWHTAESIFGSDTSFSLKPVDLTIMLGTDLSFAGINSHFLSSPSAPAGTLYTDVVNHGIQYTLDGVGAATYIGQILNGRSCTIDGTEYVISVIDIRDADRFNAEIGIPEVLQETIFLHNPANIPAGTLEQLVRQYVQALPLQGSFPVENVPVPDLHLLIGNSSGN